MKARVAAYKKHAERRAKAFHKEWKALDDDCRPTTSGRTLSAVKRQKYKAGTVGKPGLKGN